MRLACLLLALSACASPPVCGEGEWRGFACSPDVDEAVAEIEARVDDVDDAVEDLGMDTGGGSEIVRDWYPVVVHEQPDGRYVWDVDVTDAIDMHLLWEAVVYETGGIYDVDGEDCASLQDGVTADVWSAEVELSDNGAPSANIHAQIALYVDCGYGGDLRQMPAWEVVTLVVDR